MTTGSVLAQVRKQMMTSSGSEQNALADAGAAQSLWAQIQELKKEMNQAKKEAAEAAAQPYLEMINQAERRYAMMIKLLG